MTRVATRAESELRSSPHYCESPGCDKTTRERKPFCSDHVMLSDYARRLAETVESAIEEIARVARVGHKAVDLDGLVVEEILAGLKANAELTWRRLIKDHVAFLNGSDDRVHFAYLTALKREGFIQSRLSTRRDEIVFLTEKGHQKVTG